MTKRAVHFGAGNIGRGFVGLILNRAGYHVTFVDVNAELIGALQQAESYTVQEVGADATTHTVNDFDAIDSSADEAAAIRAVAEADVVTCAVGPTVLRFIAPVIRAGLRERSDAAARLVIMACENAIGATDTLAELVLDGAPEVASAAVFANTAVDRIIPAQEPNGVDVVVEDFFEWSIDASAFDGDAPDIPDAHFVDDLTPYIERKLYTVNTGHATVAYHGFVAGIETIAEALEAHAIRSEVERVLGETSTLLIERFGFDAQEHAAYVSRAIQRFENPELPDTCVRIGRQPLRKISRWERFIGPAAALAERGQETHGLVAAFAAALRFDVADDPQSVELQELRRTLDPVAFVAKTTELPADHPLTATLVEAVASASA